MKYFFLNLALGVIMVSSCISLSAQPMAQLADKQFESGDYERAALNYINGLGEKPENTSAKNRIAACYAHMNRPSKAVELYEQVVVDGDMEPKDEYLFALNLKKLGHYNRAEKWFNRYAEYNESVGSHFASSCKEASKLQNKLEDYLIFPASINSKSNEFGPCISPFGLVFNKMNYSENDDCEYMLLTADGEEASFEEPTQLNDRFEANNDVVFMDYSPSGKKVLYTKVSDKSCFNGIIASNGMSVYEADVTEKGLWENDRALPFNSLGYRTAYATYGETDDEIFYSTDQPSGFGGFDIYKSKRVADRQWSAPQNMGPSINSTGDEIAPKWNGKSLVFASNWHNGLGGFDIFYSDYVNENFFQAVNPGRPVNSTMDDWNMVFVDQESGYFTTNRNIAVTGTDIYFFSSLKDEAEARPIFTSKRKTMSRAEDVVIALPVDWTMNDIEGMDNTDPENVKTVYSIQVAVLNKDNANFEPFTSKLSDIDAIYKVFYDQVVKVRVGSYEDEAKAEVTLEKVKSRGYEDAFIVQEKMVIPTQRKGEGQQDFPKAFEEGQYKIRLATYMHPEYFQQEKVADLGEIFKIEKAPYTIFLVGHYDDLFKARKILERAKKSGFTNAQIVTRDGDNLHRIE